MRPRNDVNTPQVADPYETIHFLRASNEQWQATATRIAKQRDEAQEDAEAKRVVLSTIEVILDARDITAQEALDAISREIDGTYRAIRDGR